MNFHEGDILIGTKRNFKESYHPIVYISGPVEAPLAVVLTHSDNFNCNLKLAGVYDSKPSHFVAHLVEKMSQWGPYKRVGQLTPEDLKFVKKHISDNTPITWAKYEECTKSSCPNHG